MTTKCLQESHLLRYRLYLDLDHVHPPHYFAVSGIAIRRQTREAPRTYRHVWRGVSVFVD